MAYVEPYSARSSSSRPVGAGGASERACGALRRHSSALCALGYPVSWLTICEALEARVVECGDLARLRSTIDATLPIVVQAARQTTRPVVWSSLGRECVRAAASGDLRHAVSVPIHGPGSLMVLVTVAGRPAIGSFGVEQTVAVARGIAFGVLEEIAGVSSERSGVALTRCQVETLRLLANGVPQCEIARRLGKSLTAVKRRVSRAMDALGAKTQVEAVARAMLTGQLRVSVLRD